MPFRPRRVVAAPFVLVAFLRLGILLDVSLCKNKRTVFPPFRFPLFFLFSSSISLRQFALEKDWSIMFPPLYQPFCGRL